MPLMARSCPSSNFQNALVRGGGSGTVTARQRSGFGSAFVGQLVRPIASFHPHMGMRTHSKSRLITLQTRSEIHFHSKSPASDQ